MTRIAKIFFLAALSFCFSTVQPPPAHAFQPGYGQQTVNCSSNDGKRKYCGSFGTRDIRMVRQISGSPCIENNTWGVDRGGLWVDKGCRADFVVGGGGGGGSIGPTINCSSNNGKRNWCDIGNNRDVRLVRQISGSPCVRDSTWGVDQRGLWVDKGCRAEFVPSGGYGPPSNGRPPYGQPQMVTCSSNNGKRNWCDIGNSRDVQLVRQNSGSPCVRGDTWGTDQRGLWVDRGCRADFRVR